MKDSDHVKINSVNPLYLIIGEIDGYIEENNGNKYLTFVSTEKNIQSCWKSIQSFGMKLNIIFKQ